MQQVEKVLDRLLEVVRKIAAEEVMPRFLNTPSERKSDGSLLSEADLAAQDAFAAALPLLHDSPMLGEEMMPREQEDLWRRGARGLWIVDPIDGTNNFVNGLPHFAVSVALVRQGRPLLGVVYNPVSGECFYAERGKGAFLNGRPLPLRSVPKKLHETVAGVEIKYLRSGKLSSRLNTLAPFGTIRSMGSSTLDWCYLASGRYDIYVHGGQKLWDYAAGALIFEEAGGLLATLEGDEFWSGKHVFKRSVVAALQPELFDLWLKWIRNNQ